MYGGALFDEQVLGGEIQPSLSTKRERFIASHATRDMIERQEDPQAATEAHDDLELVQRQAIVDDPNVGAPYILFVTSTGLRAVEVARIMRKVTMHTRVTRLFAKHMKPAQQREELSVDVRVCVGTPHRLLKLAQEGYLKFNRLHFVVFDIAKTKKLAKAEAKEMQRRKNKKKNGEDIDLDAKVTASAKDIMSSQTHTQTHTRDTHTRAHTNT